MYTTNHHQLGFSPPPGAVKPLDGLDVRRRRAFGVVKKLADLKEAAEAFAECAWDLLGAMGRWIFIGGGKKKHMDFTGFINV